MVRRPSDSTQPPTASVIDTARVTGKVAAPLIAGGLIVRRAKVAVDHCAG